MKKFVVSVADVYGYDVDNGDLLFVGKTLLDTSIETSLSNTDVRGGRGNPLLYRFYHTPAMELTISDAQWNLDLLAKNVGSAITTGNNVFTEEAVTLGADGAGTVVGTPLTAFDGLYGWVTLVDGETVEKVTFTGKDFDCAGAENDVVTVRYYAADSASRSLLVKGDMVPSIVRLVLEAQLCSTEASTNVIGKVQIEIPRASMTGSFSIALAPDSVSSTPLSATALVDEQSIGGVITPVMAKITEVITGAHWYTDCTALAIIGGDFTLASRTATRLLPVRAITSTGQVFTPPYADLTFTSSDALKATIGDGDPDPHGLVTGVAAGPSTLRVAITAKNTIDTTCVVTVP